MYPGLEVLNRTTKSTWIRDAVVDTTFYDASIIYDDAGNILAVRDNVLENASRRTYDAAYTLDGLYRLIQADEGEYKSGVIDSGTETRQELWSLDQTGNFTTNQVNLNWGADSDFSDPGETDDSRVHNNVNEIKTWRPGGSGGSTYTIVHDKTGNMTSDGKDYDFIYDPFGRLKSIAPLGDPIVVEYKYNGLGYRIGWHYDADLDGIVENPGVSGDSWFYFTYDERWRMIATYRDSDANPKEQAHYHAGGLAGHGGSSYIDSVIWRDKDANTGWNAAADSTMEERLYQCQNWRADVSVVINDAVHPHSRASRTDEEMLGVRDRLSATSAMYL